MKIAMIGHKRIPSREGGIEIVVEELAVRMAAMGHEVYVYNRNCGEKGVRRYKGVHLIEVPTAKNSTLNAMLYSLLATIHIIFHHYDVVHYHAEGPSVMVRLAKLFRKKTVVTIHGLDWQRAKWGGFAAKYILLGEKVAAKRADEMIVLSKNLQDYFKAAYQRDTLLIPNGISDMPRREPDIIKEYGVSKRDYILFLSRITPEKGLHYLIDAFSQVKTDKKLIIAGRIDPTTPYIESIKEKIKGDGRIILAGFAQGEKIAELFSNCYLYILPSDLEGMPISLTEAVCCGARVLVSDISENTEFLDGYGHTFKAGDAADLKEKLQTLLDNESLYGCDFKEALSAQDVDAKLSNIKKKYDWDCVTKDTLAVYSSVIAGEN